jgi:hypothetical protein
VPYEIDRFTLAGSIDGDHVVWEPSPSARINQLPLNLSVVNFPSAE